jgi:hypothetical protein
MWSIWARYFGSLFSAVKKARARATEKFGSRTSPDLTAERASSRRPSSARAAANSKCDSGKFRLASIDRRNHATASSQMPRWRFAEPPISEPDVCHRIARTEAQGLGNVRLGFLGTSNKNLANSDVGVGADKISIQLQRMFALGNALGRAPGVNVDKPQLHVAASMVRRGRQALVSFASAVANAAARSVTKKNTPST